MVGDRERLRLDQFPGPDLIAGELIMGVLTERFRAMGTDADITIVGGAPTLMGDARRRLEDLEARWSRFRPTSEVSALNAAPGVGVRVSADTLLLVERACLGSTLTAGRFDPLLLHAMEAIGYRTTFAEIDRPSVSEAPSCRPPGLPVVDHGHRTVTIPAGTGFDPGGLGKGLAADLLVELLIDSGRDGRVCEPRWRRPRERHAARR